MPITEKLVNLSTFQNEIFSSSNHLMLREIATRIKSTAIRRLGDNDHLNAIIVQCDSSHVARVGVPERTDLDPHSTEMLKMIQCHLAVVERYCDKRRLHCPC